MKFRLALAVLALFSTSFVARGQESSSAALAGHRCGAGSGCFNLTRASPRSLFRRRR